MRVLEDERGGVLLMFAVVVTVVFMAAAVAVDFGRYVIASEKLQTAVDSASLAGAKTAYRYVKIQVYFGEQIIP